MKALTIWQPWAEAIATGAKRIETRSWPTNYRGPIAIHAAKKRVDEHLYLGAMSATQWHAVLDGYRAGPLAFGAVIAIAILKDCLRTEDIGTAALDAVRLGGNGGDVAWTERMLGNYERGRYGWAIRYVRRLPRPIPARGAQGLWEWDAPESVAAYFWDREQR